MNQGAVWRIRVRGGVEEASFLVLLTTQDMLTPTIRLIACSVSLASFQVAAEGVDPLRTMQAFNFLLAATNSPIPATSSCQGFYGQKGVPTIGNLLAMQFAYLYSGTNTIHGACSKKRCRIRIAHSAGEDVASTTMSFRLRGGRADVRSLECFMTP